MSSRRQQSLDQGSELEALVREPCRVRHFRKDHPVPRADVERMVEFARCAVTPCDSQAWRFIAVRDRELLDGMLRIVLERFEQLALLPGLALREKERAMARAQALVFAKAPLCIAVVTMPSDSLAERLMEAAGLTPEEHERLCVRPELQSAGAAVQLLATAAHAMGYGACWSCAAILAGERLEELLGITPPARLVALVPIGRPAERAEAPSRRPLEEVLSLR
ncbi:MAG: hypothetical protein GX624_00970 [Actinobacteria bacterium]|nr:hypothetical protein [Actinomycetota bacterium]